MFDLKELPNPQKGSGSLANSLILFISYVELTLSKLRLDENPAECLNVVLDEFCYMENRYEMRTIEFYARFVRGKLNDFEDFINWAGDFQSYQQILKDHFEIPSEVASTKTKRRRTTRQAGSKR